ncbi:MAG: DUF3311 domain-containing protein [Verrucomicrobiales bacterium]
MKNLIIALVIVLVVLHNDIWFWTDESLLFGFLPVGLAYHAAFSISAALLWLIACKVAWPHRLEQWADEQD